MLEYKNCLLLKEKLNLIVGKRIYPLKNKGTGEVGMLLEKLLGITANSFPIADLNGIELKVNSINSTYPITLFSCVFDGPDLFELKRIIDKYGMNVNNEFNSKVLYVHAYSNFFSAWGRFLMFKLSFDDNHSKLFLTIAHSNKKIIEKKAYWEYSTLFSILERKLKIVCFISSKRSYIGGVSFVEFVDYKFLKLKSFDDFIMCLRTGKVFVNINCGIYKFGSRMGHSYNHGVLFQIKKEHIFDLFDSLDI